MNETEPQEEPKIEPKEELTPEQQKVRLAMNLLNSAIMNGVDIYYIRDELGNLGL